MSGGIITERLFRVDGTGNLYLMLSATPPDYAMLMLISAFTQFITLVSSIVADLSYTLFDPRIRVKWENSIMMNQVDKSKLVLVRSSDVVINDEPLESKEIGYYRDSWNRFKKNKASWLLSLSFA